MQRNALAIVAMSALTLAAGMAEAEARPGFRLRSSSRPVPLRPAPASGVAVVALPAGAITGPFYAAATAREPAVVTRSVLTAQARQQNADAAASAEPAAAAKPAEPWCRTGRIAGTGSGFCVLN